VLLSGSELFEPATLRLVVPFLGVGPCGAADLPLTSYLGLALFMDRPLGVWLPLCRNSWPLQVWTAITGLAIASTLAAALKSEAKAFELSQAQHIEDEDLILTGSLPERPLFQSKSGMSDMVDRDDETLRDLLPYQVSPRRLSEALEKIASSDGGVHGAAAQTADCAHSNRVHLIVAQVLVSAYVVRFKALSVLFRPLCYEGVQNLVPESAGTCCELSQATPNRQGCLILKSSLPKRPLLRCWSYMSDMERGDQTMGDSCHIKSTRGACEKLWKKLPVQMAGYMGLRRRLQTARIPTECISSWRRCW
jgi:hypothetical protein